MHAAEGTLPPELRIVSYLAFVVSLFLFPLPLFYFSLFVLLSLCFIRLPFRVLTSGWMPIGLFLFFTFASNLLYHPGKIVYAAGPVLITQEGLQLALLRTSRVFLMIGGVKFLMATTSTADIIAAMARLLDPFEKIGVPVKDFFHTVGLTLSCFPMLKDAIAGRYRQNLQQGNLGGFWDKMRLMASFLLPLFVESIRSPEMFFKDGESYDKKP